MKRLIIEGIAVVLSILLAFAIDAWWDEQKERSEEREVIESLYVEFEANRDEAESVISILENDIQSVMTLQQLTDDEVLALPA